MRILVATLGEPAHVGPFLPTARRLVELGHEVGWYFQHVNGAETRRVVGPIRATGARLLSVLAHPESERTRSLYAEVTPEALRSGRREFIRASMLAFMDRVDDPARVQATFEVHRPFGANVALIDPLMWEAAIALATDEVPYVAAATNFEFLLPPEEIERIGAWDFDLALLPAWRAARERYFAQHGVRCQFAVANPLSPWGNATFTTAAAVGGEVRPVPRLELVGPAIVERREGDRSRGDFDWASLDPDRKLVVVGFGSQVSWQPARIEVIARAAADLPVQLVIGCGALAETEFARSLPGGAIAASWIPQLELLERAAAFVTHGGGNSVMEAHRAGVPMLVAPICTDQPIQAYFVEKSGAGLWLNLDAPDSVSACRHALQALISSESGCRARAAEIRASYAGHDSARRLSEVVLAVAPR